MRGQISLETLIVLAAFAGAFLMLLDNYNELFDAIMGGMDKKRAEYVALTIEDATANCSGTTVRINLPFDVNAICETTGTKIVVGSAETKVDGAKCLAGGRGRTVTVRNCGVEVT